MTLWDLTNGATLQGNIRLSVWKHDEEVKVVEIDQVDDLAYEKKAKRFEDYEVTYMFASPVDGYLHIELKSE